MMRELAMNPDCIAKAREYALAHPEFWLKCFEAGFGRPPQAIGVTFDVGAALLEAMREGIRRTQQPESSSGEAS